MTLDTDWSTDGIARRRDTYFAATQRKFVPFADPMIFKRGKSQYLWDENDKRYVDLLAMNVCISVGHSHEKVVAAAAAQAEALTHCTTMFYHPAPAHLAEELIATMPDGGGAVPGEVGTGSPSGAATTVEWVAHFTSSGAEAIDLALTMARSFTGRADIVALRNAYHGPTIGAQSVTGIAGFRHNMPFPPGVAFVAEPNPYRGVHGPDAAPYLDEIEQAIATATTGRIAGMIVEPVQGYAGIVPMPPGYLAGAAERVRAAGGLFIVDEVQSGFGRTGDHMWAFEADGVTPDIVVMAKGIGNGFPLGAVVARRKIAEPMAEKFLFHTYGSNPTCCAAGRAVLKALKEERLQENARTVGAALRQRLSVLQQKYECIGDVRGKGLMLAVEFVTDRRSKEPDPETTARVFEATREYGIILSKSGPHRSVLRMVPPLCLAMEDVDTVADALDACLGAA